MITGSTLRIYSDKFCQNLYETVTVSGPDLSADTSTLQPGMAYWATVEVTDSSAGSSGESDPYKFHSLPNIVLSGTAEVESDSFTRPTTVTTGVVRVVDHGFLVTEDPNWGSRARKVSGNTVTGLNEHTTYYYCPWVTDEFGRTYYNYDDVSSVITYHSVPSIKITETYTPTTTTFSGRIDTYSTTQLSAVWLECVSGGVTTTVNLVAQTGDQPFEITGLAPFTKYHLTAYATNTAGTGVSQSVYFTTAESDPTPVDEISVVVVSDKISKEDNSIKVTSVATYREGVEITSNMIYVYDNSSHTGTPVAEFDGDTDDAVMADFTGSDFLPDTTYFIFGYVEYTDGGTTGEVWSEPSTIRTYSLVTIDSVTAEKTSFTVNFSVDGYSTDTVLEYSANGETWSRVAVSDPQGGTATVTGLTPGTHYYIRMRVANTENMYSDYVLDTVTTLITTVEITGFDEVTGGIEVSISITTA